MMLFKNPMKALIEVNEQGELRLPPQVVGVFAPGTKFLVEVDDGRLIVSPQSLGQAADDAAHSWQSADLHDRMEAVRQWLNRPRPPIPPLSLEEISRETFYD
jgi:hypothetical protein